MLLSQAPLPTRSAAVGAATLLCERLSSFFAPGESSSCLRWALWPELYWEEVAASLTGAPHQRQGCGRAGARSGSVPPGKASPRKHRAGLVQKGGEPWSEAGLRRCCFAVGSGLRRPAPASRWPLARLPAPN